jgi:hypothetical protein
MLTTMTTTAHHHHHHQQHHHQQQHSRHLIKAKKSPSMCPAHRLKRPHISQHDVILVDWSHDKTVASVTRLHYNTCRNLRSIQLLHTSLCMRATDPSLPPLMVLQCRISVPGSPHGILTPHASGLTRNHNQMHCSYSSLLKEVSCLLIRLHTRNGIARLQQQLFWHNRLATVAAPGSNQPHRNAVCLLATRMQPLPAALPCVTARPHLQHMLLHMPPLLPPSPLRSMGCRGWRADTAAYLLASSSLGVVTTAVVMAGPGSPCASKDSKWNPPRAR